MSWNWDAFTRCRVCHVVDLKLSIVNYIFCIGNDIIFKFIILRFLPDLGAYFATNQIIIYDYWLYDYYPTYFVLSNSSPPFFFWSTYVENLPNLPWKFAQLIDLLIICMGQLPPPPPLPRTPVRGATKCWIVQNIICSEIIHSST